MVKINVNMEGFLILYVLYLELANNFIVFTPYMMYYIYLFVTQHTAQFYMILFNYDRISEILQRLSVLCLSNVVLKFLFYVTNMPEQLIYPTILAFIILVTYRNTIKTITVNNESNIERIYNE